MLRDARLWLGVGVGAAVGLWLARRRGRAIAAYPMFPRALSRSPRLGPYPGSQYPTRGSQR
jgi:hypothetical protein